MASLIFRLYFLYHTLKKMKYSNIDIDHSFLCISLSNFVLPLSQSMVIFLDEISLYNKNYYRACSYHQLFCSKERLLARKDAGAFNDSG